jgi:hypothetical protein
MQPSHGKNGTLNSGRPIHPNRVTPVSLTCFDSAVEPCAPNQVAKGPDSRSHSEGSQS